MSMTSKILLALGLSGALVGATLLLWFIGTKNSLVGFENDIDAQYEQNQNNLATYTNKIMDMVQVPKMATKQIRELTMAAIQGRYGTDGSKAVFHAVQEQNPTIDPGLYTKLMQAMEAGRNSFEADQKSIIDKCRVYKTYYMSFPTSLVAGFFGYPKYDASKCKPVITEQTAKDFKSKRTGPLQLE